MVALIFGVAAAPILSGTAFAQSEGTTEAEKLKKEQRSDESKKEKAQQREAAEKKKQASKDKKQQRESSMEHNDFKRAVSDKKSEISKEERKAIFEKKRAQMMQKYSEDKKQKLQVKLDAMKQKQQVKLDLNTSTGNDNGINSDNINDIVYKLESICQSSTDEQNKFYSTHAEYDQEILMSICGIENKDDRFNKFFEHMDDLYRKDVTSTPQGFADMSIEERQSMIQKIRDERKIQRATQQDMSIEEKQASLEKIKQKMQDRRDSYVSPTKQISLGVNPTDVVCAEDKKLVIKVSSGMPTCLNPGSAILLIDKGIVTYPK